MNKKKIATLSILDQLAMESALSYEKVAKLMSIAANIDDALKAKGISQKDLASRLGKQPSVVSKWLSGTHNFTCDTLMDIQSVLEIELIKKDIQSTYVVKKASVSIRRTNNCWSDISNTAVVSLAFC